MECGLQLNSRFCVEKNGKPKSGTTKNHKQIRVRFGDQIESRTQTNLKVDESEIMKVLWFKVKWFISQLCRPTVLYVGQNCLLSKLQLFVSIFYFFQNVNFAIIINDQFISSTDQ